MVGQHVRDMSEIEESEGILKDLIDKVNNADAELHVLEEEYKKDLLHHDEVYLCFPQNTASYPKNRLTHANDDGGVKHEAKYFITLWYMRLLINSNMGSEHNSNSPFFQVYRSMILSTRTAPCHHLQVRRELADTQAKRALMEAVMGETKQLQELGEYPFLGFVQKFSNSLHLVLFPVQIHQAFCKRRFFNGKQAGSRNGESARFACGGVAEAVRVPRLWSQQHGWVGGGGGGQLKMALAGWLLYIDKA